MPGIGALQVPCEVKVQAFSLPVKVAVEGKALLRAVLAVDGSSVLGTALNIAALCFAEEIAADEDARKQGRWLISLRRSEMFIERCEINFQPSSVRSGMWKLRCSHKFRS